MPANAGIFFENLKNSLHTSEFGVQVLVSIRDNFKENQENVKDMRSMR